MTSANDQFNAQYNLSPNQQGLLLAALNSNNPSGKSTPTLLAQHNRSQSLTDSTQNMTQYSFEGMDPSLFMNGQSSIPLGNFDTPLGTVDESPYMDFLDSNDPNYDPNFDFDLPETEGQMIGALPGSDDGSTDIHDKRKMSEDDDDDEPENGAKRREGEEKTAKKPGRKPLTSEPTSKRKAQNRAAQRAFRERKEKHLKDLETKVGELEKASDSANHENGLLRAQVERLQIELREYRKRLSMNSSGMLGRGTPASATLGNLLTTSIAPIQPNTFQFDFPRFGSLPKGFGAPAKATTTPTTNGISKSSSNNAPGVLARQDSNGRSVSPRSQARANRSVSSVVSPTRTGSASSTNGQISTTNDNLMSLFSPSMLNGLGNSSLDYNSFVTTMTTSEPQSMNSSSNHNSPSRIFQFNSGTNSASPDSSSSVSQYGGNGNSSCGTSPEPSHNSPSCTMNTINEDGTTGEITFCEKLNMACGNIRDPIPRTKSQSNGTPGAAPASNLPMPTSTNNGTANTSNDGVKNFDWFAAQNGGQFDPVLFGDYREPQTAIVGDGDFTGGFFNDAMPTMDFMSPFNWADLTAPTGLTPAVQKANPMDQADALLAGVDEDEVVPGEDTHSLMSCHKIWDKLQDHPDFKDGSLDIDGLCSELRAKARCSESGVVIDQKDVDSALKNLPAKRENSSQSLPGM